MSAAPPRLCVVAPCFNEQDVLPYAALKLEDHLRRLAARGAIAPDSTILFVDDGSSDETWPIIARLNRTSRFVRGLKLSRNRGHQNALVAGLMAAEGDIVISIDVDLQDDLAAMDAMIDAYREGADVVLGVRRARAADTAFKRASARGYYRMLRWLGANVVYDHADYRLLSRRALEALRQYGESNLFLRALVLQLGFKVATVPYDRAPRAAGVSKYPLRKMLSLAIEGVTSFTTAPLRVIAVAGFAISVISFTLGAWALYTALFTQTAVPGWASTVVPIYIICGVQMICLGVIGEYVGKIYMETKRRPRFIVEERLDVAGAEPVRDESAPARVEPISRAS
ncbi:MAG TPA: glycosyltransferase family 2 protein [Beijerinckiaceae bacterium]|jgi:glycosyltransferase involved in cell wall biosynthesis